MSTPSLRPPTPFPTTFPPIDRTPQTIVEAATGLFLHVRRCKTLAAAEERHGVDKKMPHGLLIEMGPPLESLALSFLPAMHRWVYDLDSARLLLPAAYQALAADAEGRWEGILTLEPLSGPRSPSAVQAEDERDPAAAAAGAAQRVVRGCGVGV